MIEAVILIVSVLVILLLIEWLVTPRSLELAITLNIITLIVGVLTFGYLLISDFIY